MIVASGTYPEIVAITAANGNVTLEAVPGVEANIDAVLQGDATPPGNAGRQDAPGIVVNAPSDRHVVIRNIVSRNWRSGIRVLGDSHVTIDGVRIENNTDYGIEVRDNAAASITESDVQATGRRVGGLTPSSPMNDFPRAAMPMPGAGISFSDDSSGTVWDTSVTDSFRAGIRADSGRQDVCVAQVNLFDNEPNLQNVDLDRDAASCAEEPRRRDRGDDDEDAVVAGPPSGRRASATCSPRSRAVGSSRSPTARRSASGGFAGRQPARRCSLQPPAGNALGVPGRRLVLGDPPDEPVPGKDAEEAVTVDDGDPVEVCLPHQPQGLVERRVGPDRRPVVLHEVPGRKPRGVVGARERGHERFGRDAAEEPLAVDDERALHVGAREELGHLAHARLGRKDARVGHDRLADDHG